MAKIGKAKLITLTFFTALAFLWALLWPIGNKLVLCLCYADMPDGTQIKAYRELDYAGFSEENSNKQSVDGGTAYFNLRWDHDDLTNIMVKPTDGINACTVTLINVCLQHNYKDTIVCQLNPALIMEDFEISDGKWESDENGFLRITPSNENCAITGSTSELTDAIKTVDAAMKKQTKVARFSSALVIMALLWVAAIKAESIFAFFERQDKWSLISILAIIATGVGVWVIAFNSGIVHPDEADVTECLKYGMKHFFPPDMRAEEVAGTYSGYGYTKLANSTWYFLVAGKIAYIASKLWAECLYFRVPNFLMFAVMAFVYIRQAGKRRWLTLILGVSAQVYYIFSYATADAMDFFLCFIAFVLLTDEDSMLFKAVSSKFEVKAIWKHVLLGVLFGFIFLGKPNYWAILALAFAVLLFKLIETPKEEKKTLWINYGVIVGFFVVTIVTRYAFDLYHYGFNISEVKAEMEAVHSAYDKNPTTPVEDIAVTYRMMSHGHSFAELFMAAPTWFKMTFRSFCGIGADAVTKDSYFKLMGILYGFVMAALTFFGLKDWKEKSVTRKAETLVLFALFVASFLASVVNSYVSDSQPQGRYLLPMLFTASFMAYRTPEIFEKKYFKASLIALQLLSAWYYVTAGVGCFV